VIQSDKTHDRYARVLGGQQHKSALHSVCVYVRERERKREREEKRRERNEKWES
jgi:hypothetical protein